jgi:hypothetical protein
MSTWLETENRPAFAISVPVLADGYDYRAMVQRMAARGLVKLPEITPEMTCDEYARQLAQDNAAAMRRLRARRRRQGLTGAGHPRKRPYLALPVDPIAKREERLRRQRELMRRRYAAMKDSNS